MAYLLDTNIVSEPGKPRPATAVLQWLGATDPVTFHLSVLTLGELRKGAESVRPRDPERADTIARWATTVAADLGPRLLPVDAAVADRWGRLVSELRATPIDCVDGLIAATALVHGLTVVTRNVRHFALTGVPTLDPFTAG